MLTTKNEPLEFPPPLIKKKKNFPKSRIIDRMPVCHFKSIALFSKESWVGRTRTTLKITTAAESIS